MPGARQARGRAPAKAKRAGRPVDERLGGRRGRPFACRQCGKRSAAFRWTKQFCSLRCRVAAHRGVPAAEPEPQTAEELDAEIAKAIALTLKTWMTVGRSAGLSWTGKDAKAVLGVAKASHRGTHQRLSQHE
jgi:hypothetical protein